MTDPALQTQKDYYEARAPEYDDWWLRRGRYDRGPEATAAWRNDAETIERWLKESNPHGSILELACGTGIWTEKLARCAAELTCVDASAAMLQHCANRVGASAARFIESDIFEFQSTAKHDVIFFGFWLSHVPPQRFDEFRELVRSAMKPDGRFFFVDSLYNGNSTASDHTLTAKSAPRQKRRLNDGREFEIYKVFHEPDELTQRLGSLGFEAKIRATQEYFIAGSGRLKA